MDGPSGSQAPVVSDMLQEQLEIMKDEISSIRQAILVSMK